MTKPQAPITKQSPITKQNKKFDLEERTLKFAKDIVNLARSLSKNSINLPLIDQLIRSGTSVGANYREANESLSKKDFLLRIRICRKEAKETNYWLKVILEANSDFETQINPLLQESTELVKIFSSIIDKSV